VFLRRSEEIMGSMGLRLALAVLALVPLCVHASRLEEALELQRRGKLKEAEGLLREAIPGLRASGDARSLAAALSAEGRISVSLGDYHAAIQEAQESLAVRRVLRDDTEVNEAFNTLGLAHLYLGDYPAALENYQQALRLDRSHRDAEGEIIRLNNIGNVFYFQGRYMDALLNYRSALEKVNATSGEEWNRWRRQLTLANLATLYQRLGKEQNALELYQQLAGAAQAMPAHERAQLLLNEGVLYRRLGDPIKALERYRAAQGLFAVDRHRDGEIGALRNIGIARALDLNDLPGALEAFTAARKLAAESANSRGIAHANLYHAEVLRRLLRLSEAESDCRRALDAATRAGLVEEKWMALYGLGRIAEDEQQTVRALECYRQAIAVIESIRAGLRAASLRTEFLADKRDVYDAVIALRLRQSTLPVKELFWWMERSRARTLEERLGVPVTNAETTIETVQARLAPDTVLLDFWMGAEGGAVLWITRSSAGIARVKAPSDRIQQFVASIAVRGGVWTGLARDLGNQLLMGVPLPDHMLVVPDGPLHILPFEALGEPGTNTLLIEKCDVTYLPSAQFLIRPNPQAHARWLAPWRRQLVAFGDPPVSAADTLAGSEQWQRLPASAEEVRAIGRSLRGRTELHLGADARKSYLLDGRMKGVPLLHFSTHAVIDEEDSDRSRMLLAPGSRTAGSDYIFQKEVYDLDLKGVDLVTISACDTARGRVVLGEGVQGFSQAFLAAGAAATATSLWRVADQPAADFMKQFYYFLAQGQTKAAALRSAKLAFLHSNSTLSRPQYWAAFIMTGDGWQPCAQVVPWSAVAAAAGILLSLAALATRSLRCHRAADT